MLSYHVRTFEASDGALLSVLVDNRGVPLFWPNAYATIKYRDAGRSNFTINKTLRTIGMAHQWAASRGHELDVWLSVGAFLNADEATDLALYLRLDSDAQRLELQFATAPSIRTVYSAEQIRGGFKSIRPTKQQNVISNEEAASRIRCIANYLAYHRNRRVGAIERSLNSSDKFKENADAAIKTLRDLAPVVESNDDEECLMGLPKNQQLAAEKIFTPGSPENPFTTAFLQHRNYLIWMLFKDTGMRRSECRYIRVEDLDYSTNRVRIRVSKTRARTVPISKICSKTFHDFIMNHWSKIPAQSRAHGYLFTTEAGNHLALDSINLIFRSIRKKYPNLPEFLSPHAMRRTWNDRFSEKIDAQASNKRMSIEEEKQTRNRLMGWSARSNMSVRYSKRHTRKKSDEIAEELANDIAPVDRDE
ncbi:tyrosine-type recombinase/integrase [Pseudomonas mohnii]